MCRVIEEKGLICEAKPREGEEHGEVLLVYIAEAHVLLYGEECGKQLLLQWADGVKSYGQEAKVDLPKEDDQ